MVIDMANTITKLITLFSGRRIGTDPFGNVYYEDKKPYILRKRRWVIYKNKDDEATRIPPMFHAWLHHSIDTFPKGTTPYKWQRPHEINKTGTKEAYLMPGHLLAPFSKRHQSVNGDYRAWSPEHEAK